MQHLVVEHILEKPSRDEGLIEQRMNPNHAIFLLNGSEDEIFFRPLFAAPAPNHFVAAQASAKMTRIHAFENIPQIKTATFVAQIKMALHRQRRSGYFSF